MSRRYLYVIYQVPDHDTPREYFLGEGLDREHVPLYRSVWGGVKEWSGDHEAVLEMLFRTFNTTHPEGYRARNLSCGDVVGLNDGHGFRYYYCARVGFAEVTDIFMRSHT